MSVTVRFRDAARAVTGSCCFFTAPSSQMVVDCGLFRGPKIPKALNYGPFPFRPAADQVRSLIGPNHPPSGMCSRSKPFSLQRFQIGNHVVYLSWIQPELRHARMPGPNTLCERLFERFDGIALVQLAEWRRDL